jgi:hypothetical protein
MSKMRLFLFLVVLLLCCGFLWGREVEISVEDTDLEIPLEGAVIRSWDGGEYVCDEDGKAVVSVPDDRQVSVQVSYPGYETGRLLIPLGRNAFTLGLRLGGVMESRELVIEAQRPGSSETKSGRSVAISGENLARSSQIGLIEDVMTSIKLLPGVGYTGMFNALPSIRGGDPGDLMAVLDGFYISNPYHWGGGFSIFDPHMVESAQLSHGIFSARYGHTISGLLEIRSKRANTSMAELELGLSTSAVNLNLSFPFSAKGGLLVMGKVTYWDPFVWAVKQLSKVVDNERLDMVNAVTTAPYIRSTAMNFNYRFNTNLEMNSVLFIGADGVAADYPNEVSGGDVEYKMNMEFLWSNLQGFLISGVTYNPNPSMIFQAQAGAGFTRAIIDGAIKYDYLRVYGTPSYELLGDDLDTNIDGNQNAVNVQGRLDWNWDLGRGFLCALGAQELVSLESMEFAGEMFTDIPIDPAYLLPIWPPSFMLSPPPTPTPSQGSSGFYLRRPIKGGFDTQNRLYNSSAYTLVEYASANKKFGAELGLRLDHLYFSGNGFDIQTMPVLNPRLNLDFNVFKSRGIVDSLDLTIGTGLFSSMNDAIASIGVNSGIDNFTLKPNRSWTSVAGIKLDFSGGWSFNLEGYFKYVYDRAYQYTLTEPGKPSDTVYRFDGDGIVGGFDLMLQKFQSRYWDGWLSYTFTWAKYHEPERPAKTLDANGRTTLEESPWYYPNFHRFHNLNLVLNFKPSSSFNIYTRLGLASGRPKPRAGEITRYDVVILDDTPAIKQIIYKYKRESEYDDDSRTTWSIPLDLKLSWFRFNPRNKVRTEVYLAAENILSLFYVAQANTSFNQYTGKEDTGSDSANYEMPIPMVSFGMKWTY